MATPMSKHPEPIDPAPEIAATYLGVDVPMSPFLTEARIRRIEAGKYEGEEIAGARALITPQDRVLELGAGLGVVGAVIAKTAQPEAVLSFEANPNLIPHIRALHAMNGLTDKIELRNQVLIASPHRPDKIGFHLANSYLGSSLVENKARKQVTIEVETADFHAVRDAFKPTVLVMDIEGAELELLQDADLRGIRAVVIEFHPGVYKKDGMKRCKHFLRTQGFAQVEEYSTRTVWACTREDASIARVRTTTEEERHRVMPGSPGSTPLEHLEGAQVVPPTERGFVQKAGVFDSAGAYNAAAALWRKGRPMTVRPDAVPEIEETLEGRWLWGGVLWDHFGHFIAESIARLWALPEHKEGLDGILYLPKRPFRSDDLLSFQRATIDQLLPGVPVRVARVPTRVEHLIVPEQGFGLGLITAGTPSFRAAMAQHFAQDVKPEGGKKLYISRSKINLRRGGVVGEKQIEAWLAQDGYEIFHPEKHDIPTQIARYKAAEVILSCEGSALHLFGMSARPDQKVGIILRRKSKATEFIVRHLKSFTGVVPTSFDSVSREWTPAADARQHKWVGELDLPKLRGLLIKNGFVDSKIAAWPPLTDKEVKAELGATFHLVDR